MSKVKVLHKINKQKSDSLMLRKNRKYIGELNTITQKYTFTFIRFTQNYGQKKIIALGMLFF